MATASGTNRQADYEVWKSHFGDVSGSRQRRGARAGRRRTLAAIALNLLHWDS